MKIPEILILGAPKCGTSSLYEYLKEHPQIFLPLRKELHFFSRHTISKYINGPGDNINLQKICFSFEDYTSFFEAADENKIIAEVSTSYFFKADEYLDEIKTALPSLRKIIIVLRNPVKRMYSNYMHQVRIEKELLSFSEALEAEDERKKNMWGTFWWYKTQSYYFQSLQTLAEAFGKNKLLIVTQEEMDANTPSLLKKIFTFLEVDNTFVPANLSIRYNKGGKYKKNALLTWLMKPSAFRKIIGFIIPKIFMKKLKRIRDSYIEKKTVSVKKISNEMVESYNDFFTDDIRKIKQEFNINLAEDF